MTLFVLVAGVLGVGLFVAGVQRPRLAVFVAAILWLLYAYYEYQVATGVLCEANCNIRVDLVFFFPILGLATFCAYQAYMGRPGQLKVIGIVLGIIGLFVVGLLVESRGHGNLAFVGVVVGVVAIVVYAFKSRTRPNRS